MVKIKVYTIKYSICFNLSGVLRKKMFTSYSKMYMYKLNVIDVYDFCNMIFY